MIHRLLVAVGMLGFTAGAQVACDTEDAETEEGPALYIEAATAPEGRVRMPYSFSLEAVDAEGEVDWSVSTGALPPGLELSPDGEIAGEPERSGTYECTVRASDDSEEAEVDIVIEIPPVVLMSGFEPFGGYPTNPSFDSIAPLDEEIVAGLDVRTVELEVSWATAWADLKDEIDRLNPDVVIGTGMSETLAMRFETEGHNIADGEDNDGEDKESVPIIEDAPETFVGSLPVAEMAEAMEEGELDTVMSDDAGKYLCNFIFYNVAHWAEEEADRPVVFGFIHVPPTTESSGIAVEEITDAHELGLDALSTWLASGRSTKAATALVHTPPVYAGAATH